jgi:hypothetical protein
VASTCTNIANQVLDAALGKCVCAANFYPNVAQNACVSNCNPEFLDISGDKCVTSCGGIFQIRDPNNINGCACETGILDESKQNCVNKCDGATAKLNIDGNRCLDAGCPSASQVDVNGDGQCDCRKGFYQIVQNGETICVTSCATNTIDPTKNKVSEDTKSCVAACLTAETTGTNEPETGETLCKCPAGNALNVDKDGCVPVNDPTMCPVLGLSGLECVANCP